MALILIHNIVPTKYFFMDKKLSFKPKSRSREVLGTKMVRYRFRKMAISPKLFEIFEFCKKHHIKKFTKSLNVKFQLKRLINESLKKYFHFSQKPRSFQGQGHFGGIWGMNV